MSGRVLPGIDGPWLDRLSRLDPVEHAWAVWDRAKFPDRVEFQTLYEDGAPSAYLLLWHGAPKLTVVHWVGTARDPTPLLAALPARPMIGWLPEEVAASVAAARAPATVTPVLRLVLPTEAPLPPPPSAGARRLTPGDQPQIAELARRFPDDALASAYANADPTYAPIFGAFEGPTIVSLARAQVALPTVWIIGGVFTIPERRGRHLATDVTRVAVRAAREAGATPALYVREDNASARRIYDGLGFQRTARRSMVETLNE
jgi:GNAT superfamily N-acetyltransferase